MWATLSISLAMILGVAGEPSPDGAVNSAVLDLTERVAPELRRNVRYLALWTVPEADRERFLKALSFWLNSTSYRRNFGALTPVADGTLLRIDLRDFGWDRASRERRLENATASGVTFTFKDEAEKRAFLDPWEILANKDPYFFANQTKSGDYSVLRGWVDPQVELTSRLLTYSAKPVLRADWVLSQLSLAKPLGVYDDFLMQPAKEADLFKLVGVDPKFVERERLERGGAALKSIVALHNRELQLIPTLIGHDVSFLWRSLDVKTDVKNQSVLENFIGTIKADGKEFIGTLPNGLHFYYLANAAGDRVGEVPTDIAQDKQDPYDNRVISPYKCVSCHGASDGINPFVDEVSKLALGKDVALAAISKDKDKADRNREAVEDYYFSQLAGAVKQQQAAYSARILAVNGLKSEVNSASYLGFVNKYRWQRLTLDQAAIELGYPADRAFGLLKASGNAHALSAAGGSTISREAFEANFAAMARAARYSWEK